MLRPARVEIQAFRGWRRSATVGLETDLTLLVGGNGDGKSSTLNAIEWCLHGHLAAKKASGIAERADWEIANLDATVDSMEVTLTLVDREGEVLVTRTRARNARPRDDDALLVKLPDGSTLEQDDAEAWIRGSGLPDWQEWRNAFCQHQEAARTRLIEAADRSALLAGLLGLEEYQELQQSLTALRPAQLLKSLEAEIRNVEEDLERAVEKPRSDLEAIETRLEVEEGIPRAEVGEHRVADVITSLIDRGARMAQGLRIDGAVPDGTSIEDLEATLAWARDWERHVRRRLDELRLQQSRTREDERNLAGAIEDLQPAHDRWQAAAREQRDLEEQHGNEEALRAQAETVESDLRQLDAEIATEADRMTCIRQARDLLCDGDHAGRCPVCEQAAPGLRKRLDALLQEGETATVKQLRGRREKLQARGKTLSDRRRVLDEKTRDARDRERAYATRRSGLQARLPTDFDAAVDDSLATGREQLRRLRESLETTERTSGSIEEDLKAHREETDVLGLLARWLVANNRARASGGNLTRHPAWDELQGALDEASGLAVDVDALSAMAREAQEQRSNDRVDEVNRRLGTYFGLINGIDAGEGIRGQVRVRVHRTAARLRYDLVDEADRSVLPILNQAALNSLSLAMLFAQAEDRHRKGWPAWVVLDDPGQSLDDDHQGGLARAVEHLAEHCPVIVGVVPGPLADRLQEIGSRTRRVLRLAPWSTADGARILDEDPS